MKLIDFLKQHNIGWIIEQLTEPNRFCVTLKQDNIDVYIMNNGYSMLACIEGETVKQAWINAIRFMRGNRLRVKCWNSKDEYVDLKINVPTELEL